MPRAIPSPEAEQAPAVRLKSHAGRAPTAVPAEWRDPEDLNPNRRRARTITGTRAADPIRALAARGKGLVTGRHVRAADRYLAAYELGVLGASGRERPEIRGNGQNWPTDDQCDALRAVNAANKALGPAGTRIVQFVVCGVPDPLRRDVASYARRFGIDAMMAMGLLVASLERLAEHYGIEEERNGRE